VGGDDERAALSQAFSDAAQSERPNRGEGTMAHSWT
jgi:hypothetical protein